MSPPTKVVTFHGPLGSRRVTFRRSVPDPDRPPREVYLCASLDELRRAITRMEHDERILKSQLRDLHKRLTRDRYSLKRRSVHEARWCEAVKVWRVGQELSKTGP